MLQSICPSKLSIFNNFSLYSYFIQQASGKYLSFEYLNSFSSGRFQQHCAEENPKRPHELNLIRNLHLLRINFITHSQKQNRTPNTHTHTSLKPKIFETTTNTKEQLKVTSSISLCRSFDTLFSSWRTYPTFLPLRLFHASSKTAQGNLQFWFVHWLRGKKVRKDYIWLQGPEARGHVSSWSSLYFQYICARHMAGAQWIFVSEKKGKGI